MKNIDYSPLHWPGLYFPDEVWLGIEARHGQETTHGHRHTNMVAYLQSKNDLQMILLTTLPMIFAHVTSGLIEICVLKYIV